MICIYRIISPSGKIYIGQSWDILRRIGEYERGACKRQPSLYASLCKYGFWNHEFETIMAFDDSVSQKELDFFETVFWSYYVNGKFQMLNLREPGAS